MLKLNPGGSVNPACGNASHPDCPAVASTLYSVHVSIDLQVDLDLRLRERFIRKKVTGVTSRADTYPHKPGY